MGKDWYLKELIKQLQETSGQFTVSNGKLMPVTSTTDIESYPEWSPDGKLIA